MNIAEIIKDVELAKEVLPELEAFYMAGKALYAKIEAINAARAEAAGGPPVGQV